uniref:Lysine transporter LysE n=1 Tax=Candidatus Methanomethylicus mesodigestus TaxID=1867258 RepID=A0A7C3IT84_9CREN
MLLELLSLFSVGLLVGLSGAVIPGPLFAFTVLDTTKKGRVTGHFVIAGHMIWESIIIMIILFGFGWILEGNSGAFYLVGGAVLALMGANMVRRRASSEGIRMEKARLNSSVGGGIFYTAFNPTQPIWWATAGLALLLLGLNSAGMAGVAVVTAGHWAADLAYYTSVSYAVHRYNRFLNPRQGQLTAALGVFLAALGLIFIAQGIGLVSI